MPRIISLMLWASVLSTISFGGNSFNRDEYRRTFDKTVSVSNGERVALDHKFGDITVHTHPQQNVVIHAEIHVSAPDLDEAKRYADLVDIQVEPSSELSIRTRYPEIPKSFFGSRNVSFSVHYDLTIPESSPLYLRNAFGAVSVTGLNTGRRKPSSSRRANYSTKKTAPQPSSGRCRSWTSAWTNPTALDRRPQPVLLRHRHLAGHQLPYLDRSRLPTSR